MSKLKPLLILLGCFLLASCASNSRKPSEPSGDLTTTTRSVNTSALPQVTSQNTGMEISSPEFTPGAYLPLNATCAGNNTVPQLNWKNIPGDSQELALSLVDYTNFESPVIVWQIAGIDPKSSSFDISQPGLIRLKNDWGKTNYGSPCIEEISEDNIVRDLQFRLFSMPQKSALKNDGHGKDSWDEINAKASDQAAILVKYDPQVTLQEENNTNFSTEEETSTTLEANSTDTSEIKSNAGELPTLGN